VASWLADERAPKIEMPKELKDRIQHMKQEGREYVGRKA
jgi:oligopeptide transport system ATP-binding protein